MTRNPNYHSRLKHIDNRYHFVRELYDSAERDIQHFETELIPADILT